MDSKTIVKYVSYVLSVIALVSIFNTNPVATVVLGVSALANIFYVNK